METENEEQSNFISNGCVCVRGCEGVYRTATEQKGDQCHADTESGLVNRLGLCSWKEPDSRETDELCEALSK